MMEEENNMLPFLNMLIENGPTSFVTNIYRKPTFTESYISWDFFVPKSRKINLVKSLTQWILMICFDCKIEAEFLKKITKFFLKNGYP